ncbi:MAG: hypothetical protein WD772_06425 [Pseudohongiellaceae bacterium]
MSRATTKTGLSDVSILLLALLFVLMLILNTGSTGYVRGGGDGDEGSGIGGTGRQGILGGAGDGSESGFGGTGFKPFLGVSIENGEVQIFDSQEIPEGITPVIAETLVKPTLIALTNEIEAPTVSRREFAISTRGEVSIDTAIQYDIDAMAQFFVTLANVELIPLLPYVSVDSQSESDADNRNGGWGVLSEYISNAASAMPIESDSNNIAENSTQRQERGLQFEKIQRPELPPVQRIRPVERVSVLPPRVLPMRI